MSLPSYPASNLDDIQTRCSGIFKLPEFQTIGWVGVFGSFAKGKQTAKSDIDLLVGFKEGSSFVQFYHLADLDEQLQRVTQRNVDILYMDNKQDLDFIRAQALLLGKTIHEVDAWLCDNRPLAEQLMVDAYRRLCAGVLLAGKISQQAAMISAEDISALENLIPSTTKLTYDLFMPQHPKAEYINSFFHPVYHWKEKFSGILQHYKEGIQCLKDEDRHLLLQALTENLPYQMRLLEKFYLPLLKETLDYAEVRYKTPDKTSQSSQNISVMAAPSVSRLNRALEIVKRLNTRLESNKFTTQTWLTPPNDTTLQLRESYIVLLNSITENLDLKQDDPLRTKHPALFQEVHELHKMCCILDHKYDVAGVKVDIDWQKVWDAVNDRVPKTLGPLLENTLAEESKRQGH